MSETKRELRYIEMLNKAKMTFRYFTYYDKEEAILRLMREHNITQEQAEKAMETFIKNEVMKERNGNVYVNIRVGKVPKY